MKQVKKVLAIILSLAIIVALIPATNATKETKAADGFVITNPTANKLMAAGYIDIKWSQATAGDVKNYELYIDDEVVTTTTKTSYEFYTTKVKAFHTYVKANYTNGTSETTQTITFGVSKKGLGLDNKPSSNMGTNVDLADMGCSWYYNWGESPSKGEQYEGIEFVPMQWGNDSYNNINNRMNNWAAKGYKYVLAFNEPDLSGQGVTSVDDAVNRWPAFQNHGIRVGSPASFLWPSISDWLKSFMVKIDNNVDFITIHCYPENNPGGKSMADWFLKDVVDSAWDLYHKPIWITEFSTSDKSENHKNVTAEGTAEFWKYVMEGLDAREYVERYAAFGFDAGNQPGTGLWNYNTGELTLGGEEYKNNGNPENFTPAGPVDPGYKIKQSTRNSLLDDHITVNNVTCEDYVNGTGVTASASSQENQNSGAEKAIDNDITSRWESKQKIDPQSLIIDLGTSHNIKQISIIWESAGAADYTVEVSEDGQKYTTVASLSEMSSVQNRLDEIVLSKMAKGRYIKINGTTRATQYGYSIFDVAVYGTDDVKVDETTTKTPATTKQPVTTTKQQVTTSQQDNTNTKLDALNGAKFVGYVGSDWADSSGTVTAQKNGDATVKIENSGKNTWDGAKWGIQAQYNEVPVVSGNTYKYTATITSDKDKKVILKITPSGVDRSLVEEIIELKAGVPYVYEAEFTADSNLVNIVYGLGSMAGEAVVTNATVTIKGNNLLLVKEAETLSKTTDPVTTENVQTTTGDVSKVKVARIRVKKATKKKDSKKVNIILKRIKGAAKYQVQISKSRKFKKKLVRKTVKKIRFTITRKKLKNKKKLYVRARAIKIVNKTIYYGKWSKAKRIKNKK